MRWSSPKRRINTLYTKNSSLPKSSHRDNQKDNELPNESNHQIKPQNSLKIFFTLPKEEDKKASNINMAEENIPKASAGWPPATAVS